MLLCANSEVVPHDFAKNNLYLGLVVGISALQFAIPFIVLTILSSLIMIKLRNLQRDTLSGR